MCIVVAFQRGCTALHLAIKRGQVGIALLLLHAQSPLDVIDVVGETPLHTAAKDGILPVVQTMCAFGCQVDVPNKVRTFELSIFPGLAQSFKEIEMYIIRYSKQHHFTLHQGQVTRKWFAVSSFPEPIQTSTTRKAPRQRSSPSRKATTTLLSSSRACALTSAQCASDSCFREHTRSRG